MSILPPDKSERKDRKKSAQWDDAQTELMVDVLLRHKENGRTPENGFIPEVWDEVASLLQQSQYVGGPKTAEACKSRWQRIQRDYRSIKAVESITGFVWDTQNSRFNATPEAWQKVSNQLNIEKYQKLRITCYENMALLCAIETDRTRTRIKQGRGSLTSISDSSSMVSLSGLGQLEDGGSSTSLGLEGQSHTTAQGNSQIQMNIPEGPQMGIPGSGSNHIGDSVMKQGQADIIDGGSSHTGYIMPENAQAYNLPSSSKRTHFDSAPLCNRDTHSQLSLPMPSSSKRARVAVATPGSGSHPNHQGQLYSDIGNPSPVYHSGRGLLEPPAMISPTEINVASSAAQATQQFPQVHFSHVQPQPMLSHSHVIHPPSFHYGGQQQHLHHVSLPQAQTLSMQTQTPPQRINHQQLSQPVADDSGSQLIPTQHVQSAYLVPQPDQGYSSQVYRPHLTATSHQRQPLHIHQSSQSHLQVLANPQSVTQAGESSQPHSQPGSQPHTPIAPTPLQIRNLNQIFDNGPSLTGSSSPTKSSFLLSPETPVSSAFPVSADTQIAGLTNSQRLTKAIVQLQQSRAEADMNLGDEDLIEVVAEFEANVAAADTYLALNSGNLRKSWVRRVLARRKSSGRSSGPQ